MKDFKVRCVCSREHQGFKVDGIYNVNDGQIVNDSGYTFTNWASSEINGRDTSFSSLHNWFLQSGIKFELVEDKPSFKVRCVKGVSPSFQTGKIYEAKNGEIVGDDGWCYKGWSRQDSSLKSFLEWSNNGSGSQFELVTEPTFTKADLRTGMRVENRKGEIYVVFKDFDGGYFANKTQQDSFGFYHEDLINSGDVKELDIMNVFEQSANACDIFNLDVHTELLWQRTEQPLQLTHKQIEKMIGHEFEYVKD